MSDSFETYLQPDPVEVLATAVESRHEELLRLIADFWAGMELVGDIGAVNELIAASPRPELVMTERAGMMPLESPADAVKMAKVNNFIPYMTRMGMPVRAEPEYEGDRGRVLGYREPDEEETGLLFELGGHGSYEAHMARAAELSVDTSFAEDLVMLTHFNKPAFMRMWIVLPELTRELMSRCLRRPDDGRPANTIPAEECFVAYTLMSQLIDTSDPEVVNDGEVDDWYLCH